MEFILEIIFEIIIDVILELLGKLEVPKGIMILLSVLAISVYILLMGGLIVFGMKMLNEDIKVSIVLFAVSAFFLVAMIWLVRKKMKNR